MRSTGSGAQPSITETIPERADDDEPDESAIKENDYERAQETTKQGRTWISMDESHEKDKQPHLRRNNHWDREYDRREGDARKKEEEIRRMEEEVKRKEEDAARKVKKAKKMEAVVIKKEADAKRKEKEARIKEEDAKRKEEVARLEEEEARRKTKELSRKEEEAKKREEDLKKREGKALNTDIGMKERENILRQREEEVMRRETDKNVRIKEEDAKRNEEAARLKEEEARLKEEEARLKEEEARLKEEEARLKEEEARLKEKEARLKEEEVRLKEEEARLKEEARQKTEELNRKEEEAKQREVEEAHKKDILVKEREDILRRREEELMRREEDNFRREEAKKNERAKTDEAFVRQEDADDDDDDSSSENGIEVKRLRDPEAKKQKLEESLARRDWATEGNRHSNYPRTYRQVSYTRQPHVDLDDDDERERERGRSRDRERHRDRKYDKDRDREGGRDIIHSNPRRSTTYSYSVSRHPSYSNPSPGGSSRPVPPPYYDAYEDRDGVPGSSHGRYNNYRGPSPDNLDYQRRPDSARLSRQSSYVRSPQDEPDRRFTVDNDGYSRHIPIPRHTPSREEPLTQPAWREWASESSIRYSNYPQPISRQVPFTRQPRVDLDDDDERERERGERRWGRDYDRREEHRRVADDELKRTELEIQQLAGEEARKKKEEEERRDEARRREEEALRREEDARRKEEEILRMEEEMKRKEDAARKAEEAKLEAIAKKEAEAKRKEKEARIKEQDAKRKEEAARLKEEEARRKAKKLSRKEEEAKQREAQLEQDTEKTKQMQLETQKIAEDLKKKEEEAHKKDLQMKEREDILRRREEELMRREADKRKADEAAKRREEDSRREEARLEDFRRDQEKKHLQYESQRPDNMFLDLDPTLVELNLMEEQIKVLQQAEFRKREEDIRRTRREERNRNDSVSSDSTWSNPSYLSNLPRTPPGMSRSPSSSQFNGPLVPSPARRAGPSTGGWGAGPTPANNWGLSIKPTATAASSPTASRSSSTTRKARTGSFSSGIYPTSSSPLTASFSEAELTRKQQEFAEEQFRRTQKKLEAERQLRSAGRLLSREELQRVFEHHERLWTRLKTLDELLWNDFPWPMVKQPSNPDDMSLSQIGAYMQCPLYPDKDKSPKDRIKEQIKRWHPDRFETKFLSKVVEDEREKVKHGAGNVARYLSDLLRKEIESNNHNIFGD